MWWQSFEPTINSKLVGVSLADMPGRLVALADSVSEQRRPLVQALADALAHAVEGHRTDRLVIAGAANLVRTEHDFTSSVYPLLKPLKPRSPC